MGRVSAIASNAAGLFLLLLGLLFLLGAAGQIRRVFIGLVFMGAGAILMGLGIRALKRLALITSEKLREDILELARRQDGEIAWKEVVAKLGWRAEHGLPVIEQMMREGSCRRRLRKSETFYIFPELQPRLMVLYCEYCKAEYPISSDQTSCPNCGGPLVTRVAVRSLSEGEFFGMDEEAG